MALTTPFAQNGDKKAIPQNTSDGSVSFDRGFGSFYALPPEEGGLFIDRAQFNQLMFDTTSQVLENKTAIATQANRINEVNTTLTQSINTKANQATTYTKTEVDDLVNTKANWNAVVTLTGDQTIAGVKTFTSNITSPNITAIQNNLNTIFSSTSSPVKTQTTNKTITVGTGGDFQDLVSAINEAKKYTSPVTINLVSNLELNQSTVIRFVNGFHITINFQNYKITNTSSQSVQLLFLQTTLGIIHNLNLENVIFVVGGCSAITLTGNVNIKNSLNTNGVPLIWIIQSSMLQIAFDVVLTINDNTTNVDLFSSTIGSILSIAGKVTINSTKNTGNLFSVYRGGIITITDDLNINKPSGLNLYNTAINTPSLNGIIFDKTGRS